MGASVPQCLRMSDSLSHSPSDDVWEDVKARIASGRSAKAHAQRAHMVVYPKLLSGQIAPPAPSPAVVEMLRKRVAAKWRREVGWWCEWD